MPKLNENYLQLKDSYLFSEIAHRTAAYSEKHPDKPVIRLGIGDVTRPLCECAIKALHESVDEMGQAATFKGYGPEQGYAKTRDAIAAYYKRNGIDVDADAIFISDGAKSDTGNITELFGHDNVILIPDPVYPVYVLTHAQNIRYDRKAEALYIIDQTLLPGEEKEIRLQTIDEMVEAIRALRVRGAPAIGICAAYCMYVLAKSIRTEDRPTFLKRLSDYGQQLDAARPTAVNLGWAIREMMRTALEHVHDTRGQMLDALYERAVAIHEDDIAKCRAISEYGLSLLKEGDGVLTHCNAGPLATSRYGTAQGPFLLAAERGMHIRVFADETRPLLQGARLTSYELQRAGVDVTLICDNMASIVMKNGWVQACFVGCDRVAANGDTANKIGTSGVAILAKHYGIPVYVLGPTSTIDMACPDGDHIPIEERDGEEIKTMWYEKPMALPEVKCYNPAFDVTDHELIAGIVTEKGICRPPYTKSLKALFDDKK